MKAMLVFVFALSGCQALVAGGQGFSSHPLGPGQPAPQQVAGIGYCPGMPPICPGSSYYCACDALGHCFWACR